MTDLITIYAVFPADYQPGEPAVAIFAAMADAQFFIAASNDADREYSANLIIQAWDVSNVAFMSSI